MSIDISQFYQVFFEESSEHLVEMERLLLEMDVDAPDIEEMNAIFRAAHSIKGGSGTFGFTDMTGVTHVLENLLDRLRRGEMAPRTEMIDIFLEAADVLREQLNCHINGTDADPASAEAVCVKLRVLAGGERSPEGPVIADPEDVVTLPEPVPVQNPSPSASEDAGFGFFDTPAVADIDAAEDGSYGFFAAPTSVDEEQGYGFFAEPVPVEESNEGFGFFAPLHPPHEEAPKPGPQTSAPNVAAPAKPKGKVIANGAGSDTSIRVSVERVDQLINLVGELVITQAMLAQTGAGIDPIAHEALHNGLAQLERNTRELQESVMSIRMMPISFVFSRFPRVVRDLAAKLNKQVELVTIGETTELDKGLIEKIADPLTHLVRNSLDHGIELPDKRVAAGKPAKGTVTLSAAHQGGNIVIEVADNGAGLNRDKILAKARERGLNISETMSDSDVWMLIFEPGFSTAEVVTDVSGRGVGMDVVKRNIAEMGGIVTIGSVPGVGTTMTIRLPLTLAILDGMSVSQGDNIYVIPLNMIVETLQPQPADIKTVTGQGRMVRVRGEYLPIIALHSIFAMPTNITDPCEGVLVLIEAEGKKAALFVDALVGQQQVVIKSLETNFRKIVGVSGATIMGDGSVALILDVATLIKMGQ